MKFWTIVTDDKDGHTLKIFVDEHLADQYALDWCRKHWHESDGPSPKNWYAAYEIIAQGDAGLMWYEEHDLLEIIREPIIHSAQAQLEDLLHQVHQMKDMFDDDDGTIEQAINDAEDWKG